MERKTLKQFHESLSWSTRIYTLLAICLLGFAYFTDAWNNGWVPAILLALLSILFVESFAIYFHHHPKAWRTIWWIAVLLALMFLLIAFV